LGPLGSDQVQATRRGSDIGAIDLFEGTEAEVVVSSSPGEPLAGGWILELRVGDGSEFIERVGFRGSRRESGAGRKRSAGAGRKRGESGSLGEGGSGGNQGREDEKTHV